MGQPQNDHATDKVRPEALQEQVVAVEVATCHEVSHPELRTVYPADYLSPAETSQGLLNRSHGGRELINLDNLLIHV